MANFKKHLTVGAFVGTFTGAGIYLVQYFQDKEENPEAIFQWSKFIQSLIAGCSIGTITGIAADIIEPALNSNHRGFFHSYSIWILAGLAVLEILSGNKDKIWKNLAVIAFTGYSSHLFLDSQTPKSLPIVGI
jgi:membrane-bound metal-dependent hydrolase YbcI (DUF457 family)